MSGLFAMIDRHPPERTALVGDRQSFTYGRLKAQVQRLADRLSPDMVLGLALDNGPLWVLHDLAAAMAGAVCVPLPPFFTPEQTRHVIGQAGVTHIVTPNGLTKTGLSPSPFIPPGTAKITFTSGTTGDPKGVCLSAEGLARVAGSIVERLGPDFVGNHLSILPLSILLENVAGVYSALMAGCTVHIPSLAAIGFSNPFAPDFALLATDMRFRKINSAILVPELLRGLMAEKPDLPDLAFLAVGGSKIAPGHVRVARAQGLPVYEGYGLSECGSVVALNSPGEDRRGSVGKPLAHVELSVVDGEIVIDNPVFLGYLDGSVDRGHSLSAAPIGGPFYTGDLGCVDEDGFVSISGRKKNVLITSYGRNISPEWVESALLARPEIAQALVFGDGKPFLSALLVPVSAGANVQAAVNAANTQLPEYARIEEFHVVPPFTVADGTMTGTGRPRRKTISNRHQSLVQEKDDEILRSAG